MWILFYIVVAGGLSSDKMQAQEFNTKQTCESAIVELAHKYGPNGTGNIGLKMICIKK